MKNRVTAARRQKDEAGELMLDVRIVEEGDIDDEAGEVDHVGQEDHGDNLGVDLVPNYVDEDVGHLEAQEFIVLDL